MTEDSPGLKALKYAEEQLGVHSVYAAALAARESLDATLTSLSEARDKKRLLESQLQDAEMEVASEEHGKHPEMSATAMREHLKVALSNSGTVRELRESLSESVGDIDGLEADRKMSEIDISIASSRLQELGGYFQYLAAIKLAQTTRAEKPMKPEGVWE